MRWKNCEAIATRSAFRRFLMGREGEKGSENEKACVGGGNSGGEGKSKKENAKIGTQPQEKKDPIPLKQSKFKKRIEGECPPAPFRTRLRGIQRAVAGSMRSLRLLKRRDSGGGRLR